MLTSLDYDLNIMAVIDKDKKEKLYKKIPIILDLNDCKDFDFIIVTTLIDAENRFKELSRTISNKKIILPPFLNFKLNRRTND